MFKSNLLKLSFVWNLIINQCVEFCLTSFSTVRYDCVIKAKEMVNFLPLINSSVTPGLEFLLLIISAIISSNTTDIFCTLHGFSFHRYPIHYSNIQCKPLNFYCAQDQISSFLIRYWYFDLSWSLTYKWILPIIS